MKDRDLGVIKGDKNRMQMKPQARTPSAEGAYPALDAEALFRAHAPFVASFLARMGVPAADLDDLVQEVFVVAHRKGGYQPGPAQPRSWLAAIALRIAQAGRRSRMRRAHGGSAALELAISDAADPAEALESRLALARVQRALDGLPIEHRAAFVLYELEGETCESIAAVWEVPVGTVYSRLHHARRRFLESYQTLSEAPQSGLPQEAPCSPVGSR